MRFTSFAHCRLVAVVALVAFAPDSRAASPGARASDAKDVLAKINSSITKLRDKLAADAVASHIRVDGLASENGTIKVAGVILVPGAAEEDFAAFEKTARAKLIDLLQELAGTRDFKDFDLAAMKTVRGEKLPHLQLQLAANDAGKSNPAADEVMLTDAKFNAKGELVISGQRGSNPRSMEWLQANFAKVLAKNYAALGPDSKPAKVILDLREPEKGAAWPLVPAAIQQKFAGAKQPGLSRLRVDRAYLAASPTKIDETNPTGVSWTYVLSGIAIGAEPLAREDANRIAKEIMPAIFAEAKWPAISSGDLEKLTVADVRVPEPAAKLQAAIASIPALDGVRIDPKSEFAADGKLVLVGLQPGLDEKGNALLTSRVNEVLAALAKASDGNALFGKLAERGISPVRLDRIKVRELHGDLRAWAAEKLDETRLSRLFYNENGALTLLCDTYVPANSAAAKAELKALAAKLRVPIALARGTEPVVKASAAPIQESLTAYLQSQITDPKKPEWDAVLIERGYFNEKNQFTLRGVANSEKQKAALAKLLASLAEEKTWSSYFAAAGAAELDVAILPMEKLVDRATRVMPAYPVFDGIRVTGAKYEFEKDAKGRFGQTLVLAAHLVGRTDSTAPAKLQALIADDAKGFARRLPKGRAIRFEKDAKQPDPSRQLAEFSIGYAAEALAKSQLDKAKGWIDVGMLHYPEDSSLWYLSAYYNLLRGDDELVRRDLFRTIDVESRLDFNGRVARNRRYEAAKEIQGEKRDQLEKLWLKCWKESKDGAPEMKFAK